MIYTNVNHQVMVKAHHDLAYVQFKNRCQNKKEINSLFYCHIRLASGEMMSYILSDYEMMKQVFFYLNHECFYISIYQSTTSRLYVYKGGYISMNN
jgi:hypothetical protein